MSHSDDAPRDDRALDTWDGTVIPRGSRRALHLTVSESYAGADIRVPVMVWRAPEPGPAVCVTGAVHGDEINGTGAIRAIASDPPFVLDRGTLVLVPVVNVLGFDRHSRYLPDRRDLNRSFPGSSEGSLAARMARTIFDAVIQRCQWGIDLHTAAVRRTNFPNVRADLEDPELAAFARAFGTELIVSGTGPEGSLRYAACAAGCRTLILEAGEVWKVEPTVIEYAIRGIGNCLRHLGMVAGEVEPPAYRVETDATRWLRAGHGGFLRFHVAPGDIVERGDPIATNSTLLGEPFDVIEAPRDGIILGMSTSPTVAPGDPICHLAYSSRGTLRRAGRAQDALESESLHERAREDLATNLVVREHGALGSIESDLWDDAEDADDPERNDDPDAFAAQDGAPEDRTPPG